MSAIITIEVFLKYFKTLIYVQCVGVIKYFAMLFKMVGTTHIVHNYILRMLLRCVNVFVNFASIY